MLPKAKFWDSLNEYNLKISQFAKFGKDKINLNIKKLQLYV